MGYRSEVALTLKKEDGLELIRQAKENEPVRNLMSCANIIELIRMSLSRSIGSG